MNEKIEVNKAVVHRYLENAPDILDEIADPELMAITPGLMPTMRRLENVKKLSAVYFRGLSERRLTVEEMIGEGNNVTARWTISLTAKTPLRYPMATSFPWENDHLYRHQHCPAARRQDPRRTNL